MGRRRAPARVRANRQNAKKSTGPRTAEGRSRAAQNALRHGLAAAPVAPPADLREDAEALVGKDAPPALQQAAADVAHARRQQDIVRAVKRDVWLKMIAGEPVLPYPPELDDGLLDSVEPWLRDATWIRLRLRERELLQREDRRQYRLSGRKRDHVEELRRLDRYEQRAFAQLRRALRALGELMPMLTVSPSGAGRAR